MILNAWQVSISKVKVNTRSVGFYVCNGDCDLDNWRTFNLADFDRMIHINVHMIPFIGQISMSKVKVNTKQDRFCVYTRSYAML